MCVHLGINPGELLDGKDLRIKPHISRAAAEWSHIIGLGFTAPFGGFAPIEYAEKSYGEEAPLDSAGRQFRLEYSQRIRLLVPVYEFDERDRASGRLVTFPLSGWTEFQLRLRGSRYDRLGTVNRWCLLSEPGAHWVTDRNGRVRQPAIVQVIERSLSAG